MMWTGLAGGRWTPAIAAAGFVAALFLVLALPEPARAQQYACASGPGPGERLVFVQPAGNGIAAIPFCTSDEDDEPADVETSGPPGAGPPPGTEALINATNALTDAFARQIELMSDPELMAFQGGGLWKDASEAGQCKAVFLHPDGVLAVYSPAQDFDGVAVMFSSDNVPQTAEPTMIPIELEETDLATGAVERVNAQAVNVSGALVMVYEGRFFPQIVNDFKDRSRVRVWMDRQLVVDVTTRNGSEAQTNLQRCMSS